MLRALVALLLLANLLFFAWGRGWLAPAIAPPHQGEREPERLAAQIRPESVRLISPQAASAAAPKLCLEAGPFSEADVGIAEATLLGAGVAANAWVHDALPQPANWILYMGRFGDKAALQSKQDELRRLKLDFEELRSPPDLTPGLQLSKHDSQAAAEQALARLAQRGVRTARVVALPPPPPQHWLRVAQADGALQARLLALKPPALGTPFAPCRPGADASGAPPQRQDTQRQ